MEATSAVPSNLKYFIIMFTSHPFIFQSTCGAPTVGAPLEKLFSPIDSLEIVCDCV